MANIGLILSTKRHKNIPKYISFNRKSFKRCFLTSLYLIKYREIILSHSDIQSLLITKFCINRFIFLFYKVTKILWIHYVLRPEKSAAHLRHKLPALDFKLELDAQNLF